MVAVLLSRLNWAFHDRRSVTRYTRGWIIAWPVAYGGARLNLYFSNRPVNSGIGYLFSCRCMMNFFINLKYQQRYWCFQHFSAVFCSILCSFLCFKAVLLGHNLPDLCIWRVQCSTIFLYHVEWLCAMSFFANGFSFKNWAIRHGFFKRNSNALGIFLCDMLMSW
jgi:hypothetical protein